MGDVWWWCLFLVPFPHPFPFRIQLFHLPPPTRTYICPHISSQAIALMSAEEALLRATFFERELWFRELRKMPAQTEADLQQLKLGMAVQIANSMHNEIFAIFMAKFIVLATKSVFYWPLHSRAKMSTKDRDSHPIQLLSSGTIATPSTRAFSPPPFPLATSSSL